MSILVVEDTAEIRENLGLILRLEGFDVREAADGIEALEKIHAEPPQLILTDLEMPHLDGFGFLETLQGDRLLHRIPVIVVTAHEGRSHIRKAMRLGAKDFIAKPWDNADLLKTIRNLLAESGRGDAVVDRDQVTGLFHRSAAIEVLPGLLARGGVGEKLVIAGAAVSGFHRFRALFGVDECHRFLKAVGERVRELAMDDSHCACLGNGLFMWVGLRPEKDLSDFLFEAKRRLEEPVDLQNGSYQPSFLLVGLPQGSSEIASQEPAVLVEGLELALQNAQAEGATEPVILDRGGEGAVSERLLDIPPRLRKSLREHPEEFSVAWQPQMTLTDGTCSGAEALLRWACPDRGPVSPGVFIPMAESWGMIEELGLLVLDKALEEFCEHLSGAAGIPCFGINVSPIQLMNPEFLDQILAALERSGCSPEVLKIELTEGVSMERMDNRGATLQRFRDQGLKISLDDFGTGFSNLAILPKLPIDELKIDRGIISGLIGDEKSNRMSRDLCKSFIEVGKSHGIRIVAEGIEDIAQADLLLDLGCELGQGYLYARPLPVAEFCDWLSRSPEQ